MRWFQKLILYYKDNPEGYWFKRKLYGWGWMPVRWQGWLVLSIYLAVIIFFALTIDKNSSPKEIVFTFLLPFIFLTITMLKICYWKGEKPKLMWGLSREDKNSEQ